MIILPLHRHLSVLSIKSLLTEQSPINPTVSAPELGRGGGNPEIPKTIAEQQNSVLTFNIKGAQTFLIVVKKSFTTV